MTLGCLLLNLYCQKFLDTPPRKGVGFVYVNFATFIFNCCKLIDNPTSCINKTQATTTYSSFSVSMHFGLGFLVLVLPYKWSKSEIRGMFHYLFALFKYSVPFSTTSLASSNCSLVHLPLVIKGLQLLTFLCVFVGYCLKHGGTFSWFWLGWSCNLVHLLWSTLIIMI
jgi:hypothetical protein